MKNCDSCFFNRSEDGKQVYLALKWCDYYEKNLKSLEVNCTFYKPKDLYKIEGE